MPAAYDNYDYPAYWASRKYEHESEVLALKEFLESIPKISKIAEIGAGYGRLTPYYSFRAKKTILIDPSSKLLKNAKDNLESYKNIEYLQSTLEKLPTRVRKSSFDAVLMVRVLHHIKDLDRALAILNGVLKKEGYLILEFANKNHLKSVVARLIKGDLTFPIDLSPRDRSSKKSIAKKTLPFINYHPDLIRERLEKHGFKIIKTISVSNVRSSFIKKHVPLETLVFIEKTLQKLLSRFSVGPSIFVLAQKKSNL